MGTTISHPRCGQQHQYKALTEHRSCAKSGARCCKHDQMHTENPYWKGYDFLRKIWPRHEKKSNSRVSSFNTVFEKEVASSWIRFQLAVTISENRKGGTGPFAFLSEQGCGVWSTCLWECFYGYSDCIKFFLVHYDFKIILCCSLGSILPSDRMSWCLPWRIGGSTGDSEMGWLWQAHCFYWVPAPGAGLLHRWWLKQERLCTQRKISR